MKRFVGAFLEGLVRELGQYLEAQRVQPRPLCGQCNATMAYVCSADVGHTVRIAPSSASGAVR